MNDIVKKSPGLVRDAIMSILSESGRPMSVSEIERNVEILIGPTSGSSVRSYLRLNSPRIFARSGHGVYTIASGPQGSFDSTSILGKNKVESVELGKATLIKADCLEWLRTRASNSIHAVVTDPPYGLFEYSDSQVRKLRAGRGGVWRIPPAFDGHQRSPLPRFTTLSPSQLDDLSAYYFSFGKHLLPILVPGANVLIASNPLLSYIVANALCRAGLERRGELVRLTMTMRGGDRPKGAHTEFDSVSVMPRSMWEPWLIFRKPLEGRVQDNLRKWGTGGFRRHSAERPFGDVIASYPTRRVEKQIAPHPSLKPQAFLRQIVRASLPLECGVILDPFAGSGSTLAAAEAVGYESVGVESDDTYFRLACGAIPRLAELSV